MSKTAKTTVTKQYIFNEIDQITGVQGERFIKSETFIYNSRPIQVLVTEEINKQAQYISTPEDHLKTVTPAEGYYNIYVIHPAFIREPINNLYLQEPINPESAGFTNGVEATQETYDNYKPMIEEHHLETYAFQEYYITRYTKSLNIEIHEIEE